MRTIELEELKLIQLDIVQALHDFCIENNIKYSLACGSLLGAIRHNGYIPWDDDIDVYMEREDYNRFMDIFPHSYCGIYEFVSLETNKEWNLAMGKLYDTRTILIENFGDWIPIGVNIDVFPIDSVPDRFRNWKIYNRIRIFIRELIEYKYAAYKEGKPIRNLLVRMSRIPYYILSKRAHSQLLNWYAQLCNGKGTEYLYENVQGVFQKQPFSREDFSETILHKFEDRELCVMKGYDHCLRCGFGDYMQLPPIEKRVSHHSFKAYWK